MRTVRGYRPLTESQERRLKELSRLADAEVDTSEIHEWTEREFTEAKPFRDVCKPKKQQITTRIDVDVLLWLKSHGKGYQTLLNDLLRKEMLQELEKGA